MATNTKGKIIIGSGIVLVLGITAWIVGSGIRKRRILNDIYSKIRDTTSSEGSQALLSEDDQIKGSYAFDPSFWSKTTGTKPNYNLLSQMTFQTARAIATKIHDYQSAFNDNEAGILGEIKKLKSQGQISMVAYAYSSHPLSYGSLADDVVYALTGVADSNSYIKQLNSFVASLPL